MSFTRGQVYFLAYSGSPGSILGTHSCCLPRLYQVRIVGQGQIESGLTPPGLDEDQPGLWGTRMDQEMSIRSTHHILYYRRLCLLFGDGISKLAIVTEDEFTNEHSSATKNSGLVYREGKGQAALLQDTLLRRLVMPDGLHQCHCKTVPL